MRLIDADDTKKNILDQVELAKSLIPIPEFIELAESLSEDWCKQIDMMPTVDAVKVVRCKECIHYWKNWKDGKPDCGDGVAVCLATPKDDAFCSEGERREDE